MRRHRWLDPDPDVEATHAEIVASGLVAPPTLGGDEEQLWTNCDVASLAEHRLDDATDPRELDTARLARWRARALTEPPWPPSARDHERCYWLLDQGECAGTIAIAKSSLGGSSVRVASLYVFPTHRGRGIAGAALEGLRESLGRRGLGLRLETSWTWQRAVRFYLRLGMWVHSWKRDLAFWMSADTSPPQIEVGEDRASLSIRREGSSEAVMLVAAVRTGDRLRFDEPSGTGDREPLRLDAMSTLGVALALRGWPLVRSSELWDQCRVSDLGAPESLAYKITIWEAWSRKHGWRVETPSIPGLDYPTWDELEARWKAEEQAFA